MSKSSAAASPPPPAYTPAQNGGLNRSTSGLAAAGKRAPPPPPTKPKPGAAAGKSYVTALYDYAATVSRAACASDLGMLVHDYTRRLRFLDFFIPSGRRRSQFQCWGQDRGCGAHWEHRGLVDGHIERQAGRFPGVSNPGCLDAPKSKEYRRLTVIGLPLMVLLRAETMSRTSDGWFLICQIWHWTNTLTAPFSFASPPPPLLLLFFSAAVCPTSNVVASSFPPVFRWDAAPCLVCVCVCASVCYGRCCSSFLLLCCTSERHGVVMPKRRCAFFISEARAKSWYTPAVFVSSTHVMDRMVDDRVHWPDSVAQHSVA